VVSLPESNETRARNSDTGHSANLPPIRRRYTFWVSITFGNFWAAQITNTGSDGWYLDLLTIQVYDIWGSQLLSQSYDYNGYIDGDGKTWDQPGSDLFYADGSWNSQPSVQVSANEPPPCMPHAAAAARCHRLSCMAMVVSMCDRVCGERV
jgi:hypothetical protein